MNKQTEENIRIHLEMFAGYTDRSVHGVDTDVMRALEGLSRSNSELTEALEAVYHWILTEFAEPNPETGEVIEAGVREIWGVVCDALARVKGETT